MGFAVAYDGLGSPADDDLTGRYSYRALMELIKDNSAAQKDMLEGKGSLSGRAEEIQGARFSMEGYRDMKVEETGRLYNPTCVDMDDNHAWWPIMQSILNDEHSMDKPVESCQDLGPTMCYMESTVSTRARQYCPEWCGCKTPVSLLSLVAPEYGCPSTCSQSQQYLEKLGSLRCQDWTPDDPQTLDGQDLLTVYLESLTYTEEGATIFAPTLNATLHAKGCAGTVEAMNSWDMELQGAQVYWKLGNLCREDNTFKLKPLSSICPESCGCLEEDTLLCPTACR